jgi:hypothetical protein
MQLVFRLPFQRLVLHSPLSVAEARAALLRQMADVPFFKNAGGKPMRGRLQADRFRCSRVINYRNLFLPVVQGRLSSASTGTRVELLFRLPVFSTLFMTVWTLGIVAILAGVLFGHARAPGVGFWGLTLPLFTLGIASAGFAFGSEALETELLLKRCLGVSVP